VIGVSVQPERLPRHLRPQDAWAAEVLSVVHGRKGSPLGILLDPHRTTRRPDDRSTLDARLDVARAEQASIAAALERCPKTGAAHERLAAALDAAGARVAWLENFEARLAELEAEHRASEAAVAAASAALDGAAPEAAPAARDRLESARAASRAVWRQALAHVGEGWKATAQPVLPALAQALERRAELQAFVEDKLAPLCKADAADELAPALPALAVPANVARLIGGAT